MSQASFSDGKYVEANFGYSFSLLESPVDENDHIGLIFGAESDLLRTTPGSRLRRHAATLRKLDS